MTGTAPQIAEIRSLCTSGKAKEIRESSQLTRGDVARDLAVSVSTVRKWELGERLPRGKAALMYLQLLRRLSAMRVAS